MRRERARGRRGSLRPALGALCLGALLILSGAAFDTPSLYVPGVALAGLALGAAAWVSLAAAGAGIARTPGPAAVEEEQPYPVRLAVEPGPIPAPAGEIVEPLLGRPLSLREQRGRPVRIDVRFARRGRRRLEPARLVVRDPLSLAVRELEGAAGEVLVLPRVEPVLLAAGGAGLGDETARARLTSSAAELELDSLRPYRPGAPAARIHWPTVARTGEVMERRLLADAESRPLVVLDAARPASDEHLDAAVRAAASLALHLARLEGCGLMLPGDRRPAELDPDLRRWPALHARLALVEPRERGFSPRVRLERRGALFWVTARRRDPLPLALRRRAGTPTYLVSPFAAAASPPPPPPPAVAASGSRPAAFAVAGCTGVRLDWMAEGRAA